jgi:hypothetical protein
VEVGEGDWGSVYASIEECMNMTGFIFNIIMQLSFRVNLSSSVLELLMCCYQSTGSWSRPRGNDVASSTDAKAIPYALQHPGAIKS